MGKNLLVGIGGRARHVKALYVGVGGKARKVKKVYIGVGGKARLVYQSYIPVTRIGLSGISDQLPPNAPSNWRAWGFCRINATFTPSNATTKSVTWTLENVDGRVSISTSTSTSCWLAVDSLADCAVTVRATSPDGTSATINVRKRYGNDSGSWTFG